ncbi:MAG: DUF177 domain-containing protein [Chloroflexi bacterium]|nr:DUF177 domain-containing protein [Chloroflexota bacterium]
MPRCQFPKCERIVRNPNKYGLCHVHQELADLKWNVSQLLKSPVGSERLYELEDDRETLAGLASHPMGTVRMIRTDRGILVLAEGHSSLTCDCSRCLEPYIEPVDFKIEEEFFPTVDVESGERVSITDDQAYTIDAHHHLDLGEPIVQYVLLGAPMKPLCSIECRGLCATCGASLNLGDCGCVSAKADSRWSALDRLRPSLGNAR